MQRLTDEEIERLEEFERAATRGTWLGRSKGNLAWVEGSGSTVPIINWQGFDDSDRPIDEHKANAFFIAAAHNFMPRLLAELKQLRGQLRP